MRAFEVLLGCAVLVHLLAAPFSKVEESFGLQATHDLLFHRADLAAYDHLEFPGVVPRSFVGSILLAAATSPLAVILQALQAHKLATLLAVRAVLGLALTTSFARLGRALSRSCGGTVQRAFLLLTAAQFHLPFYSSRTLPNTFALALSNLACALWIEGAHPRRAIWLLVFAVVVFRCDAVLLLAPVGLHLLFTRRMSIVDAVVTGSSAVALSLLVTVPIDSLLWHRRLWPPAEASPLWAEGEVLWFNTVDNRSSEWGTSPAHWYFTSALPRALLGALPLSAVGVVLERRVRPLMFAALFYTLLYSALPHKEVRFLFPVLPLFNAAAAAALARFYNNWYKSPFSFILFLGCVGLVLITLAAKVVMTLAAYWNYPGGWGLEQLHASACGGGGAGGRHRVHVDVLPAMTGVSRFGERDAPDWTYRKTEGLSDAELVAQRFTHLLSARPSVPGFVRESEVHGFSRFRAQLSSWPPLRLVTEPQVYVHCAAARGEQ